MSEGATLLWTNPSLDPVTLTFSVAFLAFLISAVAFVAAGVMPAQRASLQAWGKTMGAIGGLFLAIFYRGHLPGFVTFQGTGIMALAAAYSATQAYAKLLRFPQALVYIVSATTFVGILGVVGSLFLPNLDRNVYAWAAGVLAYVLIATAGLVCVHSRSDERRPMRVPIVALAATGTTLAALMLFLLPPVTSIFENYGMVRTIPLLAYAVIMMVASVGFISLARASQRRDSEELARRDGLTGLYNRSAFFELSLRADRLKSGVDYAIVMFDIDHFKSINDRFGHGGGDVVLAHAARLIAGDVRITDLAGRYGGEEFCVLLHASTPQHALKFAERVVRKASESTVRLRDGQSASFTLSAGYAVRNRALPGAGLTSLEDVVDNADGALYRAKRAGRNQVMGAGDLGQNAKPSPIKSAIGAESPVP